MPCLEHKVILYRIDGGALVLDTYFLDPCTTCFSSDLYESVEREETTVPNNRHPPFLLFRNHGNGQHGGARPRKYELMVIWVCCQTGPFFSLPRLSWSTSCRQILTIPSTLPPAKMMKIEVKNYS